MNRAAGAGAAGPTIGAGKPARAGPDTDEGAPVANASSSPRVVGEDEGRSGQRGPSGNVVPRLLGTDRFQVVLIEDNPGDARLIEFALEDAGAGQVALQWAPDLDAGIDAVRTYDADLVLVDLNLPGSTGLDTVRRVIDGAPEVPIVVLTGLDDQATALQALQRGAQDYLVKGHIEGEALLRAMRYAVERARTMRELQASEDRFRRLAQGNADALLVVDEDKIIRYANPAAEHLFETPAHVLVGTSFDHDVPPKGSVELMLEAGRERPPIVDVRSEPLEWEGYPARLVSLRDITEHLLAEQEIEHLRDELAMSETLSAIGALVAGMAQEIRASTTTITNVLFNMRQRIEQAARSDPNLHDLVEDVSTYSVEGMDGVSRIDRFVQDLRRFTRSKPDQRSCLGLAEAVTPAVDLFRRTHRPHIHVDAQLEPADELQLNEIQVQQVALTLLHNGAEAMPGGGRIQVVTRPVEGGAELVVQDEGAGISDYVRERMWEPFFSTKRESTGLGLPIARRIVESHGGTIVHEVPEGGRGARFVVFLPAASRP